MRKLLVIICHEHLRVRRFGDWMPYHDFLVLLCNVSEAFELEYNQEPCDKCKEENNATRKP